MADDPFVSQEGRGSYIAQATHGGTANVNVMPPPPSSKRDPDCTHFLTKLRFRYNRDWEDSLYGAAQLTLRLTEKSDSVLHRTRLLHLSNQRPERLLPESSSITDVYDEAGHELLILGEPGSGKSTLLLTLARELVGRAEYDASHPLPVILELSTWTQRRSSLAEWMSESISQFYDISPQIAAGWIRVNEILPLLDGLDEVPQELRRQCVEAILAYHKEHVTPLVICCRKAEYEALAQEERMILHDAIVVRPLTKQQIETYLEQAGSSLAAVQMILRTNSVLEELTTTPLMLSVLTRTYAGAQIQDLPQQGSAEEQQRQIFTAYVKRMVERNKNQMLYPSQHIMAWLSWLGCQMQKHNQSVFYLEDLQPDWLPARQRAYYRWSVKLIGALASALFFELSYGLVGTLFFGLGFGLSIMIGGGLIGWLLIGQNEKIGLTEPYTWSWKKVRFHLFGVLTFALGDRPTIQLVNPLIDVLNFGLLSKPLDTYLMFSSKEWIRRCVRHGLMLCLLDGMLVSLLVKSIIIGLATWLGSTLVFLLSIVLFFELNATVCRSILYFWLGRTRIFPWKAKVFLDYATMCILLRHTNGGYSFMHRLILEYFASLEDTPTNLD